MPCKRAHQDGSRLYYLSANTADRGVTGSAGMGDGVGLEVVFM